MFSATLAYCKSMPDKTARLVVPGKPAVPAKPAKLDADGVEIEPAVPETPEVPDRVLDISKYCEDLFYLAASKSSKWGGKESLAALKALGLVDQPKKGAYIAVNYDASSKSGWYVSTVAEAVDKAQCMWACNFRSDIVALEAQIADLRKAIMAEHTLADGGVYQVLVKKNGKKAEDVAEPTSNNAVTDFFAGVE